MQKGFISAITKLLLIFQGQGFISIVHFAPVLQCDFCWEFHSKNHQPPPPHGFCPCANLHNSFSSFIFSICVCPFSNHSRNKGGHHKNAGALLYVRRDLTVQPKVIYPSNNGQENGGTWQPQDRPPTPPRPVPREQGHERRF